MIDCWIFITISIGKFNELLKVLFSDFIGALLLEVDTLLYFKFDNLIK